MPNPYINQPETLISKLETKKTEIVSKNIDLNRRYELLLKQIKEENETLKSYIPENNKKKEELRELCIAFSKVIDNTQVFQNKLSGKHKKEDLLCAKKNTKIAIKELETLLFSRLSLSEKIIAYALDLLKTLYHMLPILAAGAVIGTVINPGIGTLVGVAVGGIAAVAKEIKDSKASALKTFGIFNNNHKLEESIHHFNQTLDEEIEKQSNDATGEKQFITLPIPRVLTALG